MKQQVTRRGLLQASLCCAVLAAVSTPIELGRSSLVQPLLDPNWRVKLRLTQHISSTFKCSFDLAKRIVDSAYTQATLTGLSPFLILAVVAKESSFSPQARSSYGAVGLMQVVPRMHADAVARITHPEGLEHPESNIATGTSILKRYLVRAKGNLTKALSKYSGGAKRYPERVTRYQLEFTAAAYAEAHHA